MPIHELEITKNRLIQVKLERYQRIWDETKLALKEVNNDKYCIKKKKKLLDESKKKCFMTLGQVDILDKNQKAQETAGKIDKWDFIKLKTFQTTKETILA